MKIQLSSVSSVLCAALAVSFSFLPANADLKISQTTIIDAPGMKSMLAEIPTDKRAPLLGMLSPMLTGQPWVTTTWLKGTRLRTDMGQTTVVVNSESGKDFTLNNVTKVYSIGAYDPYQKAAGMFTCNIAPTGQTGSMLGHPVSKYSITMTSSVLPKSNITGEIWSATDLPTPPIPIYADGGVAGGFGAQMAKVSGMPLAFRIIYPDTPAGTITVTSYATSIDTSTLPMTAFRIPDGFTAGTTRLATKTPSTGYPLGDGMPLDSSGPVTDEMATGQQSADSSSLGNLQSMMGSMLGGQGSSSSDSSGLGGISPQMLQGLLGALGGSGTGSSGLAGALGGGSGSTGNLSSLINPQMLQQLQSELGSLTSGDSE